jgi:ribosomal-protein-alanine N-acetyltransferase
MTAPDPILDRITLRDYRPSPENRDAADLYALDLECFSPPFRFSRRAMRSFAEAPGAIVLLAEARPAGSSSSQATQPTPQFAGFCIVHREGRTAYIVTLDVAPAFRRRGLARRLMAEVETRALAAGATQMTLHVFTGNTGAMQFYESLGYNRTGRIENFYARSLHALVYGKKLNV